jgi:hypothetical protein
MRALRLAVLVVAAIAVGSGVAACSQAVSGTGTLASDATTSGPTPTGTTEPSPTETSSPTPSPTPSPTTDVRKVRQLALCVRERATVTTTNSSFNKAKSRDGQIAALRTGARSTLNNLRQSKLPTGDRVYRSARVVYDQLNRLIRSAAAGSSPSTAPYNAATTAFSKACASL